MPLRDHLDLLNQRLATQAAGTGPSPAQTLLARFEPGLVLGSSLAGASAGGIHGLARLLQSGDPEAATQAIQGTQNALSIQPQTAEGAERTQSLIDTLSGITQAIESVPGLNPDENAAALFQLTGSPTAAAAGATFSPADLLPMGKIGGLAGVMVGARAARNLARQGDNTAARAIQLAEQLEARGASPEQIWTATGNLTAREGSSLSGVMRGADGQWRVEIPDASSQLLEGGVMESAPLAQVLSHPELFRAAPEIGQIETAFDLDLPRGAGSFRPGQQPLITSSVFGTPEDIREGLLHETQHAVQNLEGFETGGNVGRIATALRLPPDNPTVLDAYRGLRGEAEARMVENRRNLDAPAARARFPGLDFDIPTEQQVAKPDVFAVSTRSPFSPLFGGGGRPR